MSALLLPEPKEIVTGDGVFSVDTDTLIFIPAQAGDGTFLAARQLQDEARLATGIKIPIVKTVDPYRSSNTISLACGAEQAASFGTTPERIDAPQAVSAQAYRLTVAQEGVCIYADAFPGLFYAVQTLRQLVRLHGRELPALRIRDWPTLRYRGLMLDVSRRKVPTLSTLKGLVAELSHYELNVMQLYTEHTFRFLRHPGIGAGSGSLSSEDIVELDAFCRQHQVELMPNLQSFGHAWNTLVLPEYQHLAETDLLWTLRPDLEETYTLLDELYGDMLPAFTSTTFNVDCDETYDLGKGASKALADRIGVGRVYLNHILRVRDIAARYGCTIQIWGDILLNHPDLIGEVPDDVTLLDWHYEPADRYPSVETFRDAGRRFWVCPGVGSWNSIFPRVAGASVNIRNLVRDGVAAGAEGMLNTDWGDHGHYQYLGLSWHGYAFGAVQGWTGGETGDKAFDDAFGPLFFGPQQEPIMGALCQLARTNTLANVHRPGRSHTVLALFDEPLTGATVAGADALASDSLQEMYRLAEEAAATLDGVAPGHPRELTLREMASAANLTAYAARKVALSQDIRQALRDPDLDGDRLNRYIRALAAQDAELEQLRAEFEALWLKRARPSEIHVALGYYAGLRVRYRAAVNWLEEQRKALLAGRPVDAALSTYDASGYRTLWQNWPD